MEWKLMAGAAATTAALLGAARLGLVPGGGTARSMGGTTVPIAATVSQEGVASSDRSENPESPDRSSREPIAAAAKESGVALVSSRPRGSHVFTLRGTVVDENDFPLPHAHVYLAPLSLPLCDAGATAADGTFEVRWRGNASQTTIAFAVRKHDASWSGLSSIALESGEERELRLRVHGGEFGRRADKRAIEQAEMAQAGVRHGTSTLLEMKLQPSSAHEGVVDLTRMPPAYFRTSFDRALPLEIAAGEATFGLAVAPAAEEEVAGVLSLGLADRSKLEMRQRTPYRADPRPTRPLFVSVRDAVGNPIAEARVAAGQDGRWRIAFTDASGIAELPDLARDRAIELRAGGGDLGIATSTLDAGDEPARWDAVLDRGHELVGELRGPDGQPLAGWMVEFLAGGEGPWHDATRTATDGSFAIPNVGAEVGKLLVAPPSSWSFLPARVFEDVRATGEKVSWSLEADDLGEASLGLAFGGDGEPEVEVRVWQASTGRGAWLVFDPETRRHVSPKLPVGRYEVVALSPASGFSKLATVELSSGEDVDLGTFGLPEPARLELPASITPPTGAEATAPSLFLHTEACDARVVLDEGCRNAVVPAGTYLLTHEGRSFSAPASRISLSPGQVVAASGDLSDRIPVTLVFEADGVDALVFTLSDEHGGLVHATDLGAERSVRTFLRGGRYRVRIESGGRVAEVPFDLTGKANAESAVVRVSLD